MYSHADPALPSFYIRVMPSGVKSYAAVAKDPRGKQIWTTLGKTTDLNIEEAREKARAVIAAVRAGRDAGGPQTFASVAEAWMQRHVQGKGLRSSDQIRWRLNRLLPIWGGRDFETIRRGEIARLLDQIEDESGARSADQALSIISGMVTFFAKRNEDYVSPLVKGMRRYSKADNARARILSDDELRALWAVEGNFADMLKLLLLTGQRQAKVSAMKWSEVAIDGTWSIPSEAREKGNAGELVLPELALDIIRRQPHFATNPYVFPGSTGGHRRSFFNPLRDLRAKLPGKPDWKLHDLRRSARSLMSRAEIRPHICERVLGHAIEGVEGVYDRHSYLQEKQHALAALASLVQAILAPSDEKVVRLKSARANSRLPRRADAI
jgi:integrase